MQKQLQFLFSPTKITEVPLVLVGAINDTSHPLIGTPFIFGCVPIYWGNLEKLKIMEVELGLKITRTRDDTTSISDFQFAKDRTGPVFLSKETDATFILTAHLKGYKKENIDISISKDGSEISVSGEKEVQEMQMIPFKKEIKIKEFVKKFKIPDGVVLDRIKAKYKEEDAELTIVMPKTGKGMSGVGIGEVKEEPKQSVPESVTPPQPEPEVEQNVADKTQEEPPPVKKRGPKPWKPCPPLFFGGSTLLVSLIFLVIHYIRLMKIKLSSDSKGWQDFAIICSSTYNCKYMNQKEIYLIHIHNKISYNEDAASCREN
ncbi:hypothetical protein VNO77_12739 [Canavalia gladiata]|uniref:SHSP domain-containing protein n=1 Tax=Canavalia gladiata TaxID=3824 RepID=A0AAN9M121_CANGL